MATISKDLAKKIIEHDGYYDDDPRVYSVIEYDGMGGVAHVITYSANDEARYYPTQFVRNPRVLWNRNGLTREGEEFMK